MKREVAVLARENARVQAALSGYEGANPGTGEIVPGLDGPVLYRFGWPAGLRHAGIDIGVPAGTPVHAADSGRVVLSGVIGGYGKYVCVQHTQTLSTCYAHNSRLRVTEGERVHHGDVIVRSGCTGRCYGAHIHFEVRANGRPVNPRPYL
jgi:peptidoglycan DL-endopeptidase CwlO